MTSIKNYYVIDSCSLMELNRKYPIDIFPPVWQKIESLIDKGFLVMASNAILTLSLFGVAGVFLAPSPDRYEVRVIHLDNDNFGEKIVVVEYLCTAGIYTNNIQTPKQHWFYASAWEDAEAHEGTCIIKVKLIGAEGG